jgi:hypothetical protein
VSDLSTVGPSNQRVVGWNRLEGRSTFLGVPVAVKLLGAVEYTRGSGPFDGYVSFTAADGSQLVMYLDGQATGEQESTDRFGRLESEPPAVAGRRRGRGIPRYPGEPGGGPDSRDVRAGGGPPGRAVTRRRCRARPQLPAQCSV